MTDWKALCEELASYLQDRKDREIGWHGEDLEQDLLDRVHSLLARPEPKAGLTDEELFRIASDSDALYIADDRDCDNYSEVVSAMRAAIAADRARYGRPAPPPVEGQVAELVTLLRAEASDDEIEDHLLWMTPADARRAAALLERQATPVPVASDTRYEFSVYDEDYTEQVGGSAPTYAQALSEGQHYLAQYQQDGPHTLEVRRVEVLPPGAFPAPDDAPLPVLPEDAQVIEPTEHTILVPARTPVPVSERPWEREGWCDEQGRCWMGDPGGGGFIPSWRLCCPEDAQNMRVSLPAHALPLPAGEVQP